MGSGYFYISVWIFFSSFVLANETSLSHCGRKFFELGSHFIPEEKIVEFGLHSPRAERVELHIYKDAKNSEPVAVKVLSRNARDLHNWVGEVKSEELKKWGLMDPNSDGTYLDKPVYYGYRVWGPNWKYSKDWTPGSEEGFVADVDHDGNRFNPNKLLFDPRAKELSHDPITHDWKDDSVYVSGPFNRQKDSGPMAPKGVVLNPAEKIKSPITRPLKDDIIYEVHLRGLTMNDPTIPKEERGTFKGAARKAKYLQDLGITAVEFLPIQAFQNETNREDTTDGNNYWGYMTHGFFALNKRYATKESQKKHGGTNEEFREMVKVFHDHGIKVFMDVVYNHTAEEGAGGMGGEFAKLLSMRGIDNTGYYQTAEDKRWYKDNSGCGANMNCANPATRIFINDSMKFFQDMGVDGFRHDLAAVLGNNQYTGNGYQFDKMDPGNVLNRAIRELPARPFYGGHGVDLIAEPWGVGEGTYQVGGFPYHSDVQAGWAEWNGKFRDTLRKIQNQLGHHSITPAEIAERIAGSSDLYEPNGRKPGHTVNFMVAHDGFTLADLYRYNHKHNHQKAPFGPSDGGEDNNHSWDQAHPAEAFERTLARQRQAARTGFALPLLSFGVPMFQGGDEFLRSQNGNNNMWNVDSVGSWLNWKELENSNNQLFYKFAKRIIAFRRNQGAFNPYHHFNGNEQWNGLRDITWHQADGRSAEHRDLPDHDKNYMNDSSKTFIAYRLNAGNYPGNERSIYVAYNYGPEAKSIQLPPPHPGMQWHWVGDTSAYYEPSGNFAEEGKEIPFHQFSSNNQYLLDGRSIGVFFEK